MPPRACLALLLVLGLPLAAGAVAPPPSPVDFDGNSLPPGAVARLGTVRPWLGRASGTFALSPDGKVLATTEAVRLPPWDVGEVEDAAVLLWDLPTGRHLRSLRLPARIRSVRALVFSPDGRFLALLAEGTVLAPGLRFLRDLKTSARRSLHVAEVATGAVRHFPEEGEPFSGMSFCGGNRWLVVGMGSYARAGDVVVWDRVTGKKRHTFPRALAFACSPDGNWLATCHSNGEVRLLDAETGRERRSFRTLRVRPLALAFSADSKVLAAGGNSIRLWDVDTGEDKGGFESDVGVLYLRFAPGGKTLAAWGRSSLSLWDVALGKRRQRWTGDGEFTPPCSFSRDGKLALWSLDGRTVHLWDVAEDRERRSWTERGERSRFCRLTPDGLTTLSGDGAPLRVRDAATGAERFPGAGHRVPLIGLTFSPDGRSLASLDKSSALRLWQVSTGKELLPFRGRAPQAVARFAFLGAGAQLAALTAEGELCLWDVPSGREVRRTRVVPGAASRYWWDVYHLPFGRDEGPGPHTAVAFAPDRRHLAVVRESGHTELWEVSVPRRVATLATAQAAGCSLTFSPDGRSLLSCDSDRTLRLWSFPEGKLLRALKGGERAAPVFAFSWDSTVLAWGSGDRVTLLGLPGLRELGSFRCSARLLAFDRDGTLLAVDDESRVDVRGPAGRPVPRALTGWSMSYNGRLVQAGDGRLFGRARPSREDDGARLVELATARTVLEGWPDALTPDGRVAVQRTEQELEWYEVASGGLLASLPAPAAWSCSAVAFSPDGRLLATALADHTVVLWDWRRLCGLSVPTAPAAPLPAL